MAIAFGLEGKLFVSDARYSTLHKRQVIAIGVPVHAGTGPVVGVVAAWYDIETGLNSLVKVAKFNQSGYAVMVDGGRSDHRASRPGARQRGRVVVSGGAARPDLGSGRVDVALNTRNQSRLFGYRPIRESGHAGEAAVDPADRDRRRANNWRCWSSCAANCSLASCSCCSPA